MLKFIQYLLSKFGYTLILKSKLERLKQGQKKKSWRDYAFADEDHFKELEAYQTKGKHTAYKSQHGQDYLAATLFGPNGFFVEFGATNGVDLSNSLALEQMGWKGILAEASKKWHEALLANRPGSSICTECVWSRSGEELAFSDASQGVFSTISSFAESDNHQRQIVASYSVKTISLNDLLDKYDAPKFIEFLSIDTEGSELEILSAFNWEDRTFGFIAVEHNYTDNRQKIHDLLTPKGYARVLVQQSKCDDWYIHNSLKRKGESKD